MDSKLLIQYSLHPTFPPLPRTDKGGKMEMQKKIPFGVEPIGAVASQ